ncbi:Heat stress transcription factor C-2a [Apostasia shenzhenica]|uniref:Heat stress transcription factor C-2a n=1 Tax=Apostasia shenzhenica TaxID=1088818 RepID=A0A2I0A836_9ASPA|nr:Heat stress transcription factor C-2a [Apostasia shenzhenica]
MESGGGGGEEMVGAPFVVKTYGMVNDPATDAVISWGRENNSFVVLDPFSFCQSLLPAHFKHCNFSSFVRQLNTYGFRKVDPDRWEFAHALFLRGQTHLLRNIVRRNNGGGGRRKGGGEEEEDDEAVAVEVVRLKKEQRAIDERVDRMMLRLQETERRPRQMLAFLLKVVADPQVLGRLMARAGVEEGEVVGREKKRARLRLGLEGAPPAAATGEWVPAADAGDAAELFGVDDFSPVAGFAGGLETMDAVGGYAYPFPVNNGFKLSN